MDQVESKQDYCICTLNSPEAKAISDRLIQEVCTYKLPKKAKDLQNEASYQSSSLILLEPDSRLESKHLEALDKCRWLMVVCSPKARDDKGIREAIRYFIAQKGREHILPILLEGEPQNAFPPEFFEERITEMTFSDGETQTFKEIIEPLAIDVRSEDLKSSLSLLHHAKIKVVAALIGVSYDTLEQRHDKRARRRLRIVAALLISIPIILGSIFTYLWLNSQHQIDVATQKAQLSKDLLEDMITKYPELFKDIPQAKPILDSVLIQSLGSLRLGDSEYIELLPIDELLVPKAEDDLKTSLTKAMILRYLEKKDLAAKGYEETAKRLPQGQEDYKTLSKSFAEQTDVMLYPCGILVQSISEETSEACGGLSTNDIIVQAKGFMFRSIDQFELSMKDAVQDQPLEIKILRLIDGKLTELSLELKPEDFKCQYVEM